MSSAGQGHPGDPSSPADHAAPAAAEPATKPTRPSLKSHRTSSHRRHQLPPDLESFFARYPHPVFALRASALYDALVSRRSPAAPRPIKLAGGDDPASAPLQPSQEEREQQSRRAKRGRNGTQLSSREQYEGGVESDETPSPPPEERDRAKSHLSGETSSSNPPTPSDASFSSAVSPAAASPAPSPAPSSILSSATAHNPSARSGTSRAGTSSTSSASAARRAADIGANPRAHARAERILASAFDQPSRERPLRRSSFTRSSYLEGGSQKSHDPSRTAEGAVAAMYEQRAQRDEDARAEDEAEATKEKGLEAEREERDQEVNAARDRWSAHRTAEELEVEDGSTLNGAGGSGSHQSSSHQDADDTAARRRAGLGIGLRRLLTPVFRNGKFRELVSMRDDAKKQVAKQATAEEQRRGVLDKANISGEAPDAEDPDEPEEELELLTLLSRADAQECMAMLANVVEVMHHEGGEEDRQAQLPLAQLDNTVLLELSFPESSIYRHPPGSSFSCRHGPDTAQAHAQDRYGPTASTTLSGSTDSAGSTDSRRPSAGGSQRGTSRAGMPPDAPVLPHNPPINRDSSPYSPSNPYAVLPNAPPLATRPPDGQRTPSIYGSGAAPASNQNPAVRPAHHGVQEETGLLKPFLQVVATLHLESDLVICTTILANMPLPVTVTGSPEKNDKAEVVREQREAKARHDDRRERARVSRENHAREAEKGRTERTVEHRVKERKFRSTSHVEQEVPPSPSVPSPDPAASRLSIPLASPPTAAGPESGPHSPFAPNYRPSRPPLTQRSTSYSSASNASSGGSTVIGQPSRPSLSEGSVAGSRDGRSPSSGHIEFDAPTTEVTPPVPGHAVEPVVVTAPPPSSGVTLHAKAAPLSLPSHPAEPSYGLTSEPPLETPSTFDELKTLWADSSTSTPSEFPKGYVREKESRAAARRLAAAGGGGGSPVLPASRAEGGAEGPPLRKSSSSRESDNALRERQWQRRAKKREKERAREHADRQKGREGLTEVTELDENEDSDAYGGVLGYDEEDDADEIERLRAKTRTGSMSSAGSSSDREEAELEARRAQEQQDHDKRARERGDENDAQRGDENDAQREAQDRPQRQHNQLADEGRARQAQAAQEQQQLVPHRRQSGQADLPRDDSSIEVRSPASSQVSDHGARSQLPLSGPGGLTVHEIPLASDVTGHPLPSYGDPFLDTVAQTPCGRVILSVDWSQTSLGAITTWTAELRTHVMAMLASPFHTALWYGPESVLLYNDAYARLLGGAKHPASMGKSGAEGWSEVWDVLGPLAGQVMLGKTISFSDHCNCVLRNGLLEETYHSWAYITLRDAQARVIGYTNPSFETTARVIAERRLGTLRELSQLTQLARTTKDFCAKALRALSSNPLDLPFVILYTCEGVPISPGRRTKGESTDSNSGRPSSNAKRTKSNEPPQTSTMNDTTATLARLRLTLQGSIGVPDGHPSAVPEVTVLLDTATLQDPPERSSASSVSSTSGTNSTNEENSTSTAWPFVEALQSRMPVFISDLGARTHGFTQRGWPDKIDRGVVIPVMTEGSLLPKALCIIGINPRRPFNAVMAQFFNLLTRTLSTGLLSIEVAEEQSRKSRELSELNDARQAFFANISHELRTPLTLILGPLDDVLSSKTTALDEEDRERLTVVQRNAHRLLNMVNTLLDFSRLESGKMEAVYRPTLLGPRIADLASLFRSAIERGGIDFKVDIEEDKWAEKRPFYLSDEMTEKIVFNLLGNAFKYTVAGTIVVKVRFNSKEGVFSIEDSGVGIREEDLETIFDRFHRVDSSARSFEGTGIGLSLVLELVKALGGDITVDSKFGSGSVFTVRLPRGHDHLPADAVDEEPYEAIKLPPRAAQTLAIINDAKSWRVERKEPPAIGMQESTAEGRAAAGPSARRASDSDQVPSVFNLEKAATVCLVVDDNAQLRSFISNTLSKTFTVVEKANGEEALDYALAHPEISIVVTDLAMPLMGGRELLSALRNNPETSLVPVIFLSAQAGAEARVDALLLGADDYIVKPFQARELLARVNVHLQLGQMRKELERRVLERTAALLESEQKLKELAEQHQTLAQVSPVGIFQMDPTGKMIFVNPRYVEITQHPPDKPHEDWEDDVHPDDVERVRELLTDAMSNWRPDKGVATVEYRYKAGNWVQLELRSFDKGFIGSITDITHQKEVEAFHIREVEQRAQEADENRRNTEMFLDMSSHELRNPLSGVWQNAEVVSASLEKFVEFLDDLREGEEPRPDLVEDLHAEMLENVDAIESIMLCASHQTRIADDILNVSKLNMGLLSINVAPFDLVAAVREVVKTFEVQSHQQQIRLGVEQGPSLSQLKVDWIVADSGRIKQITYNFLTNALKYTVDSTRKTVTVHVDVYAGPPPTPENAMRIATPNQSFEPPEDCVWCVVGVQDSGKGLSQEQLGILFARFSQANPKSDQYGGSGLGLYVSKKLVELHRGFIEVESEPGKGSTFRFAIPAPRASPPAPSDPQLVVPGPNLGPKRSKRPVSSSGRGSATGLSSISSPPTSPQAGLSGLAPLHILVVEDNLINQKVMMRQLRSQNFVVSLASDGVEALEVLQEDARKTAAVDAEQSEGAYNPIRVVLMDIEMPRMTGLEAVRELRRREEAGEIGRRYPVCAVTGNAREAQKTECLEAGFDDVAIKPYRLVELVQQISTLTGLPLPAPK
ncbi:uncharacterized protein JCM10292_004752 [Rhodotorula paludigena]|uniref:uncharacterized protein n=1 Tax=Rhodotorula paludigena TaxID=86838 RepID=UPI0031774692